MSESPSTSSHTGNQEQTQTNNPPAPIKLTFLTYKLPHVSPTEFSRRWISHGIETAKILRKHGCIEHTQSHVSSDHVEKLAGMVTEGARKGLAGWKDNDEAVERGMDCPDGVATMVFRSWEGLEGFLKDEENKELARRDVPHFTDYSKRKMIVGSEVVFLREELTLQ